MNTKQVSLPLPLYLKYYYKKTETTEAYFLGRLQISRAPFLKLCSAPTVEFIKKISRLMQLENDIEKLIARKVVTFDVESIIDLIWIVMLKNDDSAKSLCRKLGFDEKEFVNRFRTTYSSQVPSDWKKKLNNYSDGLITDKDWE